jgi:hypothetical protein
MVRAQDSRRRHRRQLEQTDVRRDCFDALADPSDLRTMFSLEVDFACRVAVLAMPAAEDVSAQHLARRRRRRRWGGGRHLQVRLCKVVHHHHRTEFLIEADVDARRELVANSSDPAGWTPSCEFGEQDW